MSCEGLFPLTPSLPILFSLFPFLNYMPASQSITYQNWLKNLAKLTPDLILLSSREQGWTGLDVAMLQYNTNEIVAPGFSNHLIVIHPKQIPCLIRKLDGQQNAGAVGSGECSIIAAKCENQWQWQHLERCTPLHLALDDGFLRRVALEDGYKSWERLEIINQFAVLDPQIQKIGFALKAELDNGCVTGRLFAESLATALATRLLKQYSTLTQQPQSPEAGLPPHQLQTIKNYINDNLSADLKLADMSALIGLSSSHFTRLFRQSVGIPPYQYVIQCRIERAKILLKSSNLTIAEIAALVGFHDQSHFTYHFKRIVGVTPKIYSRK